MEEIITEQEPGPIDFFPTIHLKKKKQENAKKAIFRRILPTQKQTKRNLYLIHLRGERKVQAVTININIF